MHVYTFTIGDVDFTPVNMTVELLPADDSYLVEVGFHQLLSMIITLATYIYAVSYCFSW